MSNKQIFIFLILLTICNKVFSQENSSYYLETINSKEYTKERKETILDSLFSNFNYDNFYDIHEYSRWFWKNGNLKKAISINKKIINHKELKKTKNDGIRKRLLKNLGYFNYLIKEYYESLYYYNQATLISGFEVESAKSYKKIGQIFFVLGDYYNAEKYYDKALTYAKTTNLNLYIGICIEASINLKKTKVKKKFSKGVLILQSAIKIINDNKNVTTKKRILETYTSLGDLYNEFLFLNKKSNFKQAYNNYKISLKIAKQTKDFQEIANILNSIGFLHLAADKNNTIDHFKKSLKYSTENLISSTIYSNLSNYYKQKEQLNLSLENINKAVNLLTTNKQDSLSKELLKTNKHKFYLLNKLIDKGIILNKLSKYEDALKTFKKCDYLLDLVRYESNSISSKLFWQEKATRLFTEATKTCYFLNDTKSAFYFIEKNKAILLLENINKQKYNQNDEINFEIFKNLKMSDYKTVDFSNESKIMDLKEVQNNLPLNTVLLDYIINDDFGYLISVSKHYIKLYKICNLDILAKYITSYLQLISKPITDRSNLKKLEVLSKKITKIILPFQLDKNNYTKLIISPDYNLQNIPFESLNYNNKFLIETFETSYIYSYSYLIKNNIIKREPKKQLISFAPYAFNYDKLETLNYSLIESEEISEILDGKNFEKELAVLKNFEGNINDFNIINISSHANASDSINPWIAFKDQKLYLDDIYKTKNQAELVVLNACKTSLGEIKKGEGVFSLARGFFRSGSKSVVSSLWNVNDKSNSEITINFYKYLKKGFTKSAALRQAKLDYLKTHNLSEASPYYWSSLILIGDDSAIQLKKNHKQLIYNAIAVILAVFLILFIKKSKMLGNIIKFN
ncbi:CHAT domain-containing protein [Olleya sp. YSTF-M6]|uniref:CHAT domain-containing protein n=1 Tax=Olleya sediminilitoris TaxID=2795739 RepID=A0ABS1WJK5_9FLAO|nr:CHAT domain-containing protein [Olleya sediminilitoris]MBL7559299.1 CHAT domain-containing protein [Olleya sediminilitoris]